MDVPDEPPGSSLCGPATELREGVVRLRAEIVMVKVCAVLRFVFPAVLIPLAGCVREPEGEFVNSPRVEKLNRSFQKQIRAALTEYCGTPLTPKLAGESGAGANRLAQGATTYTRECRPCHGLTGDGNGPAAASMLPKPRDYRAGIFKFTSTVYGAKPLREDLVRTVKRGIAGTSMPSFRLLPQEDLDAVVDYVLALTRRGELESQLADAAEFDEKIDPKAIPGLVDGLAAKWTAARGQVVFPLSPMPVFTAQHVAQGKQAFLTKGCSQCHGDDGRGQTKENIGVDVWGNPTKAADLTSGMLRGGTDSLDIYRHINAGINGTPMPSFKGALEKEPETMWTLTAYVLDLSNQRRKGAIPEAGLLKPLPGVEEKARAAKPASARPFSKLGGLAEVIPWPVEQRGSH
jgi:mono/diheme cytochrome c family protein